MTPTSRAELVALLRGFFACPLIAGLDELGLVNRMKSGPFALGDLSAENRPAIQATLRYLQSLGLVMPASETTFQMTAVGEYVFDRAGVFHLLRSYRDYFDDFAELLSTPGGRAEVRRLENVGGTGQIHARKYFPSALKWLKGRDIQCVIDVGCGNGEFLSAILAEHPAATAVGVDLSVEAVAATRQRLGSRVRGVVADGASVAEWAGTVPDGGRGTIVSIWFVLHEFAGGEVEPVTRFFRQLRSLVPNASVVVGEIVALPSDGLAAARLESVYPELLLFHALSGQGVLSWDQHQTWLDQIPYRVAEDERFDVLPVGDRLVPSSVVWHLAPQNA